MGPLAWCIGRVLVGVEWYLGCEVVFSSVVFGMSVEISVGVIGTGVLFSRTVCSNLDFRWGSVGFVRVR